MKKSTNQLFTSLILFSLCLSAFSQQGKVGVLGYTVNEEAPLPFLKKEKDGSYSYDSRIVGIPKFFDGHIITIAGQKIEGKIALFNNTQDWEFVKRALLIVPDGEENAQYLKAGTVVEAFQRKKKGDSYYDYYDGILLERLIDGPLRLYYNPAANTSRSISEFVSPIFIDSIKKNVMERSIENDLKGGKTLQESLEKAALKQGAIEAFSAIELVDKEYLLFEAATNDNLLVTKENYTVLISKLFEGCSSLNEKEIKSLGKNFKKIEEAVSIYNSNCAN